MGLGVNSNSNNWKYVLANFIVMFVVQLIFRFDELMNLGPSDVSWWIVGRIITNSAVATFIFYGFNKLTEKEKTP